MPTLPVVDCRQVNGAERLETRFHAEVDNHMLVCISHGHWLCVSLPWVSTRMEPTSSQEMLETAHWSLRQARLNRTKRKTVA